MKRNTLIGLVFVSLLLLIATSGVAQAPPERNRAGDAISIVLNDSSSTMTIEYRTNSDWKQLTLEAGKDATVAGDRVRVSTLRGDKAMITVDLPIQAGQKYRLAWNARTGIWDISLAQ
jgi:hypothetical protein